MQNETLCSKKSMYVNAVFQSLNALLVGGAVLILFWAYLLILYGHENEHSLFAYVLPSVSALLLSLFLVHELKKLFRIWKSVMDGSATRRVMGAVHENWKCFFLSRRFTEAYQARMAVLDEEARSETRRREQGFVLTQALTAVQEARMDVRSYIVGVADAFATFESVDEAVHALECAGADMRWFANPTYLRERCITREEALIENFEAAQELIPHVSRCENVDTLAVFKAYFLMSPTRPFPDPDALNVPISLAYTRLKKLSAIEVAQIATIEDHLRVLLALMKVYGFQFENLPKG